MTVNNNPNLIAVINPDGQINIRHYHGVLKQLQQLQYEYQCILIISDLKYLNENHRPQHNRVELIYKIIIDCLISGIDPSQTIICIESKIPELAELQQILGAITPLGWLERIQNYKEIIDAVDHTELSTYGLLGIPLHYSNILLGFDSTYVLEDEEKISYIELSREIARRFNHIYGREDGFEEKAHESIQKLGEKKAELYLQLLTRFQQDGDDEAAERAIYLLEEANNLSFGDRQRLEAFLENKGRVYLNEPQMLSIKNKLIGTNGEIMANEHDNTIALRENKSAIEEKLRAMPTDPARVRRTDAGNPTLCPVWQLHQVYSNQETKDWAEMGCISAAIGCLECKQSIASAIIIEQEALEKLAKPYQEDPMLINRIISDGCSKARDIVCTTLNQLKEAINMNY